MNHHLQSALRARRRRQAALLALRRERLLAGPEAAADEEWAVLGALIRRPRLVRAFALHHPPAWFTDHATLAVMRALFCASAGERKAEVDDVIAALETHDDLERAGGVKAVRALAAHPDVEHALRRLEEILDGLPLDEREVILLEEALDAREELERGAVVAEIVLAAATRGAPVARQLELFVDREDH